MRRDTLVDLEHKVQAQWEITKPYDADFDMLQFDMRRTVDWWLFNDRPQCCALQNASAGSRLRAPYIPPPPAGPSPGDAGPAFGV